VTDDVVERTPLLIQLRDSRLNGVEDDELTAALVSISQELVAVLRRGVDRLNAVGARRCIRNCADTWARCSGSSRYSGNRRSRKGI
jgi:hypothetical protein